MGTVVLIHIQNATPFALHVFYLAFKARLFDGVILSPSAERLMMVEFRKWRPQVPVAGFLNLQAEIDIIEGDGKIHFIEAMNLLEYFLADEHARGRYGRKILSGHQATEITGVVSVIKFM